MIKTKNMKKKTYTPPVIEKFRLRPHLLSEASKTMKVHEESVNSTEVLLGRGGSGWDEDE